MTITLPEEAVLPPETPAGLDDLFASPVTWRIPRIADRYDYKKDPGSSDTRHQEDVIAT